MQLKKRAGGRHRRPFGPRPALAACLGASALAVAGTALLTSTQAYADDEEGSPDVVADCASRSPLLKWCDFVAVTGAKQINDKDTPIRKELAKTGRYLDNCSSPATNILFETFASSAESSTMNEDGKENFSISGGFGLKGNADILKFDITKEGKTATADFTVRVEIPPYSKGELKFEPYMVETKGWWNAWYKEKRYGHWNWSYGKDMPAVILRVPLVLPGTNTPEGKYYAEVQPCAGPPAAGKDPIPGKNTKNTKNTKKEIIPAEVA